MTVHVSFDLLAFYGLFVDVTNDLIWQGGCSLLACVCRKVCLL